MVAISTDDVATLKRFKAELKLPYPLLSDAGGKVAAQFAGTMPVVGVAKRANFVLEKDGKVKEVIEGGDAVDPSAAVKACGA